MADSYEPIRAKVKLKTGAMAEPVVVADIASRDAGYLAGALLLAFKGADVEVDVVVDMQWTGFESSVSLGGVAPALMRITTDTAEAE